MVKYIAAKTVGEKIAEARNGMDLTQAEFGEVIGITRNHIAKIETGHRDPSIGLMTMIARLTDCPVEWFLQDDPDTANTAILKKIDTFKEIRNNDSRWLDGKKPGLFRQHMEEVEHKLSAVVQNHLAIPQSQKDRIRGRLFRTRQQREHLIALQKVSGVRS